MTSIQQLDGMDAAFLHMETPRVHMHTIKVLVFEGGRAPRLRHIERDAQRLFGPLPMLRKKVVELPLQLGQPVWQDDEAFDLRNHVHFAHLAGRGDQAQLDALVSRVTSEPLRRDRPLWEMTVVDGLQSGRWAAVLKIHHTLADGGATVGAFTRVLRRDSSNRDFAPSPAVTALPSKWTLFWVGAASVIRSIALLPGLFVEVVRGRRAIARRRADGGLAPVGPYDGPHLSFNRAVSSRRVFKTVSMPLERLRAVKNAAGVTLNDAVLGVTTGALRRYLRRRGELPKKALVASVPISIDAETRTGGNRVSTLFAALHVNVPDPRERLGRINANMSAAKEEDGLRNIDAQRLMQMLPAGFFALLNRVIAALRLGNYMRPPINLVVSNVRGPETLVAGRQSVSEIYSVGPLLGSVGLNVTVWSYRGEMFFGLLADPELSPDLERLVDDFEPALDELELAFRTRRTAASISRAG